MSQDHAAGALRRKRGYPLRDKVVLLTGATGGIGAATARELHARGARLVLADLRQAPLDELAGALGAGTLAVEADVTDRASLARLVEAATDRFGGIDVVLANAGIALDPPTTVLGADPEAFERVIEVDLLGVYRTVHAALPQIVDRGGYVLVTSSIYAFINGVINSSYAASKAGIESLARSLRVELAGHGGSAGVLYPGWVQTPIAEVAFGRNALATAARDRTFPGFLASAIPPEQVARAVARGIERRKARIFAPRPWAAVSALRGVVNPLSDLQIRHDRELRRMVLGLEQAALDARGAFDPVAREGSGR